MYLHRFIRQSGCPTKTLHIEGNPFNDQKLTGLGFILDVCVFFKVSSSVLGLRFLEQRITGETGHIAETPEIKNSFQR